MNQPYPPQQNQPPQQPQQPPYPAQFPQTPYPVQTPQGQYPAPYNPQYPQPYGTQPKTNGLCIASLVSSLAPIIMTWIPVIQWFGFLASIAAIILGAIGLKKVKESNGAETGKGLAIAGIVIGSIDIFILIFVIVIAAIAAVAMGSSLLGSFGNW